MGKAIECSAKEDGSFQEKNKRHLMVSKGVWAFPFGTPLKILVLPWIAALPGVTGIVRISRTQSPASAEVSIFYFRHKKANVDEFPLSVATWCQMNMSSSPLKPWSLPVFVPASTWQKAVAKMVFTSECGSTLSTLSASARCCLVLERIDSRQVCLVPLESSHWPSRNVHLHQVAEQGACD